MNTKNTYRINVTASYGEPHLTNILAGLDGREYKTREEACEAIYERLYDLIDERGCEMVERPDHSAIEDDEEYNTRLSNYLDDCHDYILEHGSATDDGVTATVELRYRPITSYKTHPDNVEIFTDDGCCHITLHRGCDFGGAEWTDEEAIADAREILRDHDIDDTTADNYLINLIADQFPRVTE